MIWKTQTHQFTATLCQRTGQTCPALARAARALTQAMASATPTASEDLEIDGSIELTHCARGCSARFRASAELIRFYCDADPETTPEALEGYAELMFGTRLAPLPAKGINAIPCAMLEATPLIANEPEHSPAHALA